MRIWPERKRRRQASFQLLPFTQEELTAKRHCYELEPCESNVLCLDYVQSGLGSNGCGPDLAERYRLDDTDFMFELQLVPRQRPSRQSRAA
nr:hypothetical protein [Bifidobacterium commune]